MLDWLVPLAEAFAGAVEKYFGLDISDFLQGILDVLAGLFGGAAA
jgi:hypothetical protein